MKKRFLLAGALMATALMASNTLYVFKDGVITYSKAVGDVDSIKAGSGKVVYHIDGDGSSKSFNIANIDSMTFAEVADVQADGNIYIIYKTGAVEIINPYFASGLTISVDGTATASADETLTGSTVTVNAATAISDLTYHVQGTTTDGSLAMASDKAFNLSFENANITSSTTAPVSISTTKAATVSLTGTNALTDGTGNNLKAALYSKSELIFDKASAGTLSVTGNTKHAIFTSDLFELQGGSVTVESAASDAVHCDDFTVSGGTLTLKNAVGDLVDAEKDINVSGGTINLTSNVAATKGLKSAGLLSIAGGTIEMNLSGDGAKGLKTDTTNIEISGGNTTINLTGTAYSKTDTSFATGVKTDGLFSETNGTLIINVAGQGGKAIKADKVNIAGGTNTFSTSGANVTVAGDDNVSTAIKANTLNISAGTTDITVASTATGAKGLHADDDLNITGGTVNVTCNNLFSTFTNASNQADSTFVACIKGESNVNVLGGNVTLISTANGKGINGSGNTSVVTIGQLGSDDSSLQLNITTTPNTTQYTTSSGESGTRTHFKGNPKGIACGDGKIIINGGTTVIKSCANGVHGYITEINGGVCDITAQYSATAAAPAPGGNSSSRGQGGQGGQGGSTSTSGTYYKGFRGDTIVNINGGYLIVRAAYEGVEGFRITATGGTSEVVSTDDAWNATSSHIGDDGSSSSSSQWGGWGGMGGMGGSSSSNGYLNITGGVHYLYAGGDGLDSNGDEVISGGLVIVNQNGTGGNGIFDSGDNNNVLSASGDAVVFGIGGSDMNESFSTSLNNTGYKSVSVSNGGMAYVTSGNTTLLALRVRASQSASAAIFINGKYSNCSISTSGSATLDRLDKTYGSYILYVNPDLYK